MQYFITLLIISLSLTVLPGCSAFFDHKHQTPLNVAKVNFDESTYPCIIAGGGVAGLTAATYLAQANIACFVAQGSKPGGALAQSDSVRNWPGILNAPGKQIISSLTDQVKNNQVSLTPEEVVELDTTTWPYALTLRHTVTGHQRSVKALTLILAMGAQPNYLGVPGEQDYWGRGVTNCAICDGALYKNQDVVVVGGGDSAVLEATYLASLARNVTIVVRKDHFRAHDKQKRDALLKKPNVQVLFSSQVTAIGGNGQQVTGITVVNSKNQTSEDMPINGVFLAIGSTPNNQLVQNILTLDTQGYIQLFNGQHTSLPGVFAAGDICDPIYKQAVTSASDGCKAALQAQHLLSSIGYDPLVHPHPTIRLKEAVFKQEQPSNSAKNQEDEQPQDQEADDQTEIVEITTPQQLKEILQQKKPLILDCYTDWCHWCKVMEPTIEALAQDFAGKINFYRLNLTATRSFSANAPVTRSIMSVPTFLFIKDGKEVHRLAGAQRPETFKAAIKQYFGIV